MARSGLKITKVESVTVHWIGPYPGQSPEDVITWWRKNDWKAYAHAVIKDKACVQAVPWDEVAWHCGNRTGNMTSIGIEVVPMNKTGTFSAESIMTLKAVLNENGWAGLPLKRHFDWSGKDCPKYYTSLGAGGNSAWKALIEELKAV